mgnify:CR=1 FL=1
MIDSLLDITGIRKYRYPPTESYQTGFPHHAFVQRRSQRLCSRCHCAIAGKERHRQFHGRYRRRSGGARRNPKKSLWRIGINKPIDDSLAVNQELQTILQVTDVGIATSGNYRNYYYKEGKKYAHTIDPRTGYPVQHSILSATVIARDCMSADAYATAFMVMGLEEAERFADSHPDLDACFIYADEKGELRMFYTKGMDKYMTVK